MRPVPLSDNLADKSSQGGGRTEEAAIHAEIAERIIELREIVGENRTVGFFQRMCSVWEVEPPAFWMVQRLLTGDLSQITISYTAMGKEQNKSKQAVQQEIERIIAAVRPHFPEVANAIVQMRSISARLEGARVGVSVSNREAA